MNFYGKHTFRDIGAVIDLMQMVNTLDAFHAEALAMETDRWLSA